MARPAVALRTLVLLALLAALLACAPTPTPSPTPPPTATATPVAAPTASPTPVPSPSPGPASAAELPLPPNADRYDLVRRFKGISAQPPPVARSPLAVGQVDSFQLLDLGRLQLYTVQAELRLVSAHAYWYVDQAVEVSQGRLEEAARQFEERLRPQVVALFGDWWPTNEQGEPRLSIIHARLRGAAGYYSSSDEYPQVVHPASNERKAIYVDTQVLRVGTSAYYAVLAHELQHALHWLRDPAEEAWVNEGLSEVSSFALGYPPNTLSFLREHPQAQLTAWSEPTADVVPHYAASYLFFLYLASRVGGYESLKGLVQQPGQGVQGVDAYLASLGPQETFLDLFKDWVVANLLPNPTGKYTYPIEMPRLPSSVVLLDAGEDRASVPQFAARYVEVRLPSGSARLTFEGDQEVALLPTAPPIGAHCWWGNLGDNINTRLVREVDLSGVAAATLSFRAWYDTEEGWDYAYVVVSSDGGATWQALKGRFTTTLDPVGNSLGPALTGRSSGWVDETMDLSPYAGRKVLLGFEYVTDDVFSGDGLCVDDIAIPQIGLFDDAETPGAWQAQGFARTDNRLRQEFAVQVVGLKNGELVFVRPLTLDAQNRGALLVDGFGDTIDTATVVIAPVTGVTRQPASYRLTVGQP